MPEQSRYYGQISVVDKRASRVERERAWLHFTGDRLTGRLVAGLVTLQPLHVGSGALLPPDAIGLEAPDVPLVKAFARNGAQRIIPGSALKGAIRSLVELFTPSCVCKTKDRQTKRDNQRKECQYNARRHEGNLCPACKIFGAMGYQGQVRFDDAPQQVGGVSMLYSIPPQYQPRPNPDYRRYYPHGLVDSRERTWPLEVVPVGQHFTLQAQFTNLSEAELGVLLIALGEGEWTLCPKIGAGKSSGLGAVRVESLSVEQLQPREAYQAYENSAAWKAVDTGRCIERAGQHRLYRVDALKQLRRDLAESAVGEVAHAGDD